MTYESWIMWCDRLLALEAEGAMTDDVAYDWRDAYEWGESPLSAVRVAVMLHDSRAD